MQTLTVVLYTEHFTLVSESEYIKTNIYIYITLYTNSVWPQHAASQGLKLLPPSGASEDFYSAGLAGKRSELLGGNNMSL